MIFRLITVIILLNFCDLHGQESSSNNIFDINGLPLMNCKVKGPSGFDSCVFITTNGKNIPVDFNLKYKGGYEALRVFCDSLYYKVVGSDFQELNERISYFILFDNCLNINEIRIYKRNLDIDNKYDDIIKRVLLKTEGNWENENKTNKWHIYFGQFYLR